MAQNARGIYFNPQHDRAQDWDFLRAWQPNVIRLMLPGSHSDPNSVGVDRIKRVHDTCPNATILLRVWDVDDRKFEAHDAMAANPQREAAKQIDWWTAVIDRAEAAGVPRDKLMAGLNNETGPEKDAPLFAYTKRALELATPRKIRLGVFCFSVGRPSLSGEGDYNIGTFAQLDPLIVNNRGAIILHEYMQPEGMYAVWTDSDGNERKDYTYLIGRNTRWLVQSDIIIGEWGIDGILYNRHPDPTYGNSGWRNFKADWPPSRYADEYVECIRKANPNVIGICPFISDWSDHKWQSFDMIDAYPELLARKDLCVIATEPPHTTHLPNITNGKDPAPTNLEPTPQPDDRWERTIAFVLREEGDFQNHAADPGNYYQGRLIGTKYGISAKSWAGQYDIPSLTIEQAKQIYFTHYWQASGADKLSWPACLVAMDTAVLHGTGTAQSWIGEVGTNAMAFAAKRLMVYTASENWDNFGAGWVNRTARLLQEASK